MRRSSHESDPVARRRPRCRGAAARLLGGRQRDRRRREQPDPRLERRGRQAAGRDPDRGAGRAAERRLGARQGQRHRGRPGVRDRHADQGHPGCPRHGHGPAQPGRDPEGRPGRVRQGQRRVLARAHPRPGGDRAAQGQVPEGQAGRPEPQGAARLHRHRGLRRGVAEGGRRGDQGRPPHGGWCRHRRRHLHLGRGQGHRLRRHHRKAVPDVPVHHRQDRRRDRHAGLPRVRPAAGGEAAAAGPRRGPSKVGN